MFSNAELSKDFWAEVLNNACYIVNKSPLNTIECKTLEEVWSKSLDLRLFRCHSYAHVNDVES